MTTIAPVEVYFDANVTLPVVHDLVLRQPDFVDELTDSCVWIGPDAAVEVPLALVGSLVALRDTLLQTRVGKMPCDVGIEVHPHDPAYKHPASTILGGDSAVRYTSWRAVLDTVTAAA